MLDGGHGDELGPKLHQLRLEALYETAVGLLDDMIGACAVALTVPCTSDKGMVSNSKQSNPANALLIQTVMDLGVHRIEGRIDLNHRASTSIGAEWREGFHAAQI